MKRFNSPLVELGLDLSKFGADGKFGDETGKAVAKFKADHQIFPSDPVVGTKTIKALDDILFKKGGGGGSPASTCADGAVSNEKEPLPPIPQPTIKEMNANDLLELAKKKQPAGQPVPAHPPLGFTSPTIGNIKPASVRSVPGDQEGCLKCVADWDVPIPTVEIFIATGIFPMNRSDFSPRGRGCVRLPPVAIPSLVPVKKRILPEAEPVILNAEMEHWSDFVITFLIVAGRYLSNIRRLTPERTHLRGKDQSECLLKVSQFLFDTTTAPIPLPPLSVFGRLAGEDVTDVYINTTSKREPAHTAISGPPADQTPVIPNIDPDKNPFGCKAYFRKFDKTLAPGVPGPPFSQIVEDKNGSIPKGEPWHTL
ncbi:peptidoglycan-binding domain-containing protein [Puia sp. P3]|uniref:peptidoglycan-binding domain-containing protein n=1 Tax=Puia sp. P3 TaxID=3423952 RepID=UPI003D679714